MEQYLQDKRDELVWALAQQGYTGGQLIKMFSSIKNRTDVKRIIDRQPSEWQPKWIKRS